jgi:putative FmdB family regulatory protein
MPIYEYRCLDCKRRVSVFLTYAEYGQSHPSCPQCGGSRLERLISRVRFARSEESRLDSLSDPSAWGGVDENDPKSVARMMRKMGGEMGEEMGPDFHEAIDRMEAGESPESIERDIPSLGGDSPAPGGMDDFDD